jgi:hypothetical protein
VSYDSRMVVLQREQERGTAKAGIGEGVLVWSGSLSLEPVGSSAIIL